jgi:chemotaxis methyl-accepting protein methylase
MKSGDRSQDVAEDPPFSNLDLISCRNFLIHVQPELQEKIISTLHYALNPSGLQAYFGTYSKLPMNGHEENIETIAVFRGLRGRGSD